MKRTQRLEIRLTPEELAELETKAAAAGVDKSKLLRDNLGRLRVLDPGPLQELVRQVAAAGNNLNQLARWANTYPTTTEAAFIIRELVQIRTQLRELQDLAKADPEKLERLGGET